MKSKQTFICKKCKNSLSIDEYRAENLCKRCYLLASENNTPIWKPYGYERNLI
jgi:uncharacterized CHY-type Zn-finger protein